MATGLLQMPATQLLNSLLREAHECGGLLDELAAGCVVMMQVVVVHGVSFAVVRGRAGEDPNGR
jgi:hypothetical protein